MTNLQIAMTPATETRGSSVIGQKWQSLHSCRAPRYRPHEDRQLEHGPTFYASHEGIRQRWIVRWIGANKDGELVRDLGRETGECFPKLEGD